MVVRDTFSYDLQLVSLLLLLLDLFSTTGLSQSRGPLTGGVLSSTCPTVQSPFLSWNLSYPPSDLPLFRRVGVELTTVRSFWVFRRRRTFSHHSLGNPLELETRDLESPCLASRTDNGPFPTSHRSYWTILFRFFLPRPTLSDKEVRRHPVTTVREGTRFTRRTF